MRSFSFLPSRLILVPSALQSHALLPFHFIQHFVPPLRFFSPCPRPSGKVPGFSCENGTLSPVACMGTGSTGHSGGTWHFHPRGKCREFLRKRFTFPRGRTCHRLYRSLWPHSPFLPSGKVPGFSAKTVHFPPWHETSGEVQQSLLGKVPSIQAL